MGFGSLDGSDDSRSQDVYINPVTGDPMTPEQTRKLGSMLQGMASQAAQMVTTPGAVMTPNPHQPGTEEHAYFENTRRQAMQDWAPGMAMSMVGAGAPMAEAGALGAAGGALRNKFTGAFKGAEAGSDLPRNQMYTNKARAQAIAENSANAKQPGFPDLVQNAPIDPALVAQNLSKFENPMTAQAQQAARPAPLSAQDQLRQAFISGNGHPDLTPSATTKPVTNWKNYLSDMGAPPDAMPVQQTGGKLDTDFWRRMMPIIMGK